MAKRNSAELKRLARQFLMGNYTLFILSALITLILPAALLSPFAANAAPGTLNFSMVTYYIAAFIISILSELLSAGVIHLHMQTARRQPVSLMDLFWTFRNRPDRFILAVILKALLVLPPAAPLIIFSFTAADIHAVSSYVIFFALTLLFLIFAVMISLTYSLIYPLYMDHAELSVTEGFQLSRTLMHGNKKRLFTLYLSFLGWALPGILSLGVGMLWIRPYMTQTITNLYLDITNQLDPPPEHIDATISDEAAQIYNK